ncbi:MAG TPA: hypothetical protein DCS07_02490 [Bdellovibrionales bacterium]|nr:hypothetical protein [Bdellovibrionales bacterium]HCM39449.1 hypothetical protein [Bdellovibrionales bacterium]
MEGRQSVIVSRGRHESCIRVLIAARASDDHSIAVDPVTGDSDIVIRCNPGKINLRARDRNPGNSCRRARRLSIRKGNCDYRTFTQ